MKKILAALAVVMSIAACSSQPEQSFKGKDYEMLQAQNGVQVILSFAQDENRFYGRVVNNYFGNYEASNGKIKFGDVASTMMMGPADEMEAEHNFLQILPKITAYRFSSDNLVLITDNGQELAFKETKAEE